MRSFLLILDTMPSETILESIGLLGPNINIENLEGLPQLENQAEVLELKVILMLRQDLQEEQIIKEEIKLSLEDTDDVQVLFLVKFDIVYLILQIKKDEYLSL